VRLSDWVVMVFQYLRIGQSSVAVGRARRGAAAPVYASCAGDRDSLLDDFNLLSGFSLDDIASSTVSTPQSEQLLDLLQRERALGVLDEAEARQGGRRQRTGDTLPEYGASREEARARNNGSSGC